MRTSYLAVAYKQRLELNNRIKVVLKHWIRLRDKLTNKLIRIDISPDQLVIEHRRNISRGISNCTHHISILRRHIKETETLLNRIPLG